MSDRQQRFHYSSRTASEETTENLYDLGLLRRPKAPSVSSTVRSYRSDNGETNESPPVKEYILKAGLILTTMADICLGRLARSFDSFKPPTRPFSPTVRDIGP
jgi:hypothetical protein